MPVTLEWSKDKVDLLVSLVDEGLPIKEIWERMGLSKSSVIAKMHRLGISKNPPSTTLQRLEALNIFPGYGNCVFPIGVPNDKDFHFCAAPIIDNPLKPYCGHHRVITTP